MSRLFSQTLIFGLLGLSFATSPVYASNKKLICDVRYVVLDVFGHPIVKDLPDGHAEADFEDQYHSATIMRRTKELVDMTAYVDQDTIETSMAYQTEQTSFAGPSAGAVAPFRISLFNRGKDVILNKESITSVFLQCLVE